MIHLVHSIQVITNRMSYFALLLATDILNIFDILWGELFRAYFDASISY